MTEEHATRARTRNRGFSAGDFFFPRSLNGAVLLAGARHRSRRFVALKFGLDNSRSRSRGRGGGGGTAGAQPTPDPPTAVATPARARARPAYHVGINNYPGARGNYYKLWRSRYNLQCQDINTATAYI